MTKKSSLIEVTCSSCRALCCRLEVRLIDDSDEQIPLEYTTKIDDLYFVMKQGLDGWCEALDRTTMLCSIYKKRPFICREYQAGDHDCLIEREKLNILSNTYKL